MLPHIYIMCLYIYKCSSAYIKCKCHIYKCCNIQISGTNGGPVLDHNFSGHKLCKLIIR